jgi:hypothetical protein
MVEPMRQPPLLLSVQAFFDGERADLAGAARAPIPVLSGAMHMPARVTVRLKTIACQSLTSTTPVDLTWP